MAFLGGDCQVRVITGGEAAGSVFVRLHSGDTIRTLVEQVEAVLIAEGGIPQRWCDDFTLLDLGSYPPTQLQASQAHMTLQEIGMWPGGTVSVVFAHEPTAPASQADGREKRPAPSEVLSSHLNRFRDAPIAAPAVRLFTAALPHKFQLKLVLSLCSRNLTFVLRRRPSLQIRAPLGTPRARRLQRLKTHRRCRERRCLRKSGRWS